MNRATKAILIIIAILVAIAGIVTFFQRDNIKALYYSKNSSLPTIEKQLRENSSQQDNAVSGFAVRKLTDEEKQEIKDGILDSTDALNRIVEAKANEETTKTKIEADGVKSNESPLPSVSPKNDYDAQLAGLIGQIYVLEATYSGAVENLLSSAVDEYKALPPEQHTSKNKVSIGAKYLGIATSMESKCDQQMAAILNDIESVLISSGKDLSLLSRIKNAYESEKTLKKEYYLSLYSYYMQKRGKKMKIFGEKILALAAATALIFTMVSNAFAAGLADMPSANHWSFKALDAAVSSNLLKGDTSDKLNPGASLTRAEMAAIINRAFGTVQAADISSFKDVPSTAWYYSDIAKAILMGSFIGNDTYTMKPESAITRQEAFTVLARVLKLTSSDTSVLDKFSDSALVAAWAKNGLAALVAAGYVNGSDGKLNPIGTITREEFAQLMYNAIRSYISTAGTITEVSQGNVLVNVAGVTLKNLTVNGDLIIGDGVGNGDLTLDNVVVKGRMVVRGGGKNSIKITNKSSVGNIIISKASDGAIRIVADSSSSVTYVYTNDGNDGIIVEGTVSTLTIEGTTAVEVKGTITNVVVKESAKGAVIQVDSGSTVQSLECKADNLMVTGSGKITAATVSGDNTSINVAGTKVTVDTGVQGTTANGVTVTGGSTATVTGTTPSGGGVSVTTYETQIDTLLSLSITQLNGMQSDSVLTFSSTTNNVTCTIVDTSETVKSAVASIQSALAGQTTAKKDHVKDVLSTYIKSVRIGSHTLSVSSSMTSTALETFLLDCFSISGTDSTTLITSYKGTYTAIVTDTNGNTIAYTLLIK